MFAERKGASSVRPGHTAFETVIRESDVITLHCPLNAETRHMIGLSELQKMKKTALLINTARGGLVDEQALVKAMNEKLIGGAGFDVLSKEPPKEGNPLLTINLPNFILTPHVAWAGFDAMMFMANQLIDNLEAFVRGESKNRVV
jgi:glycerate dehydrogenase